MTNQVEQSGLITPGHVATWVTTGVIKDGGVPPVGAPPVAVNIFGAVGDGVADDTAAIQKGINFVNEHGGFLLFNAGIYRITSGLTLQPDYPSGGYPKQRGFIGPGTIKPDTTTSGAIFTLVGGGDVGNIGSPNPVIITIKNLTFDFTNCVNLTSGILNRGVINCHVLDNSFKTDNVTSFHANFACIQMEGFIPGDSNTTPYWNVISGNVFAPFIGTVGQPVYGILMKGQVNATIIKDNSFITIDAGIAGTPDPINFDQANAVFIHNNFFQLGTSAGTAAILNISSSAGFWAPGWIISGNRCENTLTFFEYRSTSGTPGVPNNPVNLYCNMVITGVTNYILNSLSAPYTSFEPGLSFVGANTTIFNNGVAFNLLNKSYKIIGGASITDMPGYSSGIPGIYIGSPSNIPTVLCDSGSLAGSLSFNNTDSGTWQIKINNQPITSTNEAGNLVASNLTLTIPVTIAASTYSQTATDSVLIGNFAGTVTLTLLSAAARPGRQLYVRNNLNQSMVSAGSNIVINGAAASTAILAATAGKWALLQSDGSNWVVIANN